MAPAFQAKKRKILDQLSAPESSYNDLSPKGSVDEGIRDLVHEINRMDDYVTTSSCAGRVAVFLEGATKSTNASSSLDHDRAIDSTPTLSSQTGKGGGRWLFVSHHPVDLAKYSTGGSLLSLLGLGTDSKTDFPPAGCRSQFIHFKFEPMILHILTSSLSSAQNAYTAAMTAGFRESGISGVNGRRSRGDDENNHPEPMLAIRSTGLAFDSVVGFVNSEGHAVPMVSEEYLRVLMQIGNERFVVNAERRERFNKALLDLNRSEPGKNIGWEPQDARKERKRIEGLQRQKEIKRFGDGTEDEDRPDDSYVVDLLFSQEPT